MKEDNFFALLVTVRLILLNLAMSPNHCTSSLWSLKDIYLHLRLYLPLKDCHRSCQALLFVVQSFAFLCKGDKLYSKIKDSTLEEILDSTDKDIQILLKRLTFLTWLFVFFTSQRAHFQLARFFFLFHYRGLSYAGFYILKQYHLFLHPRTLKSCFENVIYFHLPVIGTAVVYWFDNLFRKIRGENTTVVQKHFTVFGCTNLRTSPLLYNGQRSIDHLFDISYVKKVSARISSCFDFNIWRSSVLKKFDFLSVPIRDCSTPSYTFRELNILDADCGKILGTSQILGYLKNETQLWHNPFYVFLAVDYDIYWRLHKFIFSCTFLNGSLKTFKDRTIVIPGIWHIFKTLADSVWKKFSTLILVRLWCNTSKRICPTKPAFPDIIFYFICLYAIQNSRKNTNTVWNSTTLFGSLLSYLMDELIPLVF